MDTRDIPYYYRGEIPAFLEEAFALPLLRRLKGVGMHCGLEYTSFPYFSKVMPYDRFRHSLGVALLCFRFSRDEKVALAGAFHDVATPCFAHVVDFLKGDPIRQEATEKPTAAMLRDDPATRAFLLSRGIELAEVEEDSRYPIANNATPKLSCDRLEYTLSNFLHFGYLPAKEAAALLDDLVVGGNEDGEEEIQFAHLDAAKRFGVLALENAKMYTRREDRYAMEALSRALRKALDAGVLTEADLMGEEAPLIEKWRASPLGADFERFAALREVRTAPKENAAPLFAAAIPTKKRYIDPLVRGKGRLSALCPIFRSDLADFLSLSFGETLYGYR